MMDNLKIDATDRTPKIYFSHHGGILEIAGRSIPENSSKFYDPLLEWMDNYIKEPKEKTIISIKLDYFNTTSAMYVLGILRKLEQIYLEGKEVEAKWYYDIDDEGILQTGKDLKQLLKMPLNTLEFDGGEQEEAEEI